MQESKFHFYSRNQNEMLLLKLWKLIKYEGFFRTFIKKVLPSIMWKFMKIFKWNNSINIASIIKLLYCIHDKLLAEKIT